MTARRGSATLGSLLLLLLSSYVNITTSITSCEDLTLFLHQPKPSDGVIPFGGRAVFSCSVAQGYKIERWRVYHLREFSTNAPSSLVTLLQLGITLVEISPSKSMLIVNATLENNGDKILCEAVNATNILEVYSSCEVDTLFYGPPSAPTKLMVTGNGAGSLSLSWFLEVNERIPTNFTLKATNLNSTDSSTRVTEISGIEKQELNFTMEVDSSCHVYSFQVTASNGAGISGPSGIISRSIPSIPDLTSEQKSLTYSLAKTTDGILLTVNMNVYSVTSTCPEYPVTGYALVVEDSAGSNTTGALTQPTANNLLRLEITLLEDEEYSISIEATNAIGTSTTGLIQIITSDVQGVSVCLMKDSTYLIQCRYIAGSNDTSGCRYVLMGEEMDVTNLTGTIDGTDAEQVQISKFYSTLSVFDVQEGESANSSSAFLIASVSLESVKNCSIKKPPNSVPLIIIIIVPTMVAAAFLIILTISLLTIILRKRGST